MTRNALGELSWEAGLPLTICRSTNCMQHLDLELIQEQTSQCLVAVSSVMCSNKRLLIHVTRYKVQTEPTEIKARLQKEWDKA